MSFWLWGALISFLCGALIGYVNYLISRITVKKNSSVLYSLSFVRQLIQIGYLLLIYFISPYTPWSMWGMLIGGAMGMTLPMIYYTARLVRLSDAVRANSADDCVKTGKGEDPNG